MRDEGKVLGRRSGWRPFEVSVAILLRMLRFGRACVAKGFCGGLMTLGASLPAAAQQVAPQAIVTGTVTGRVICSDTNGPARFAAVTLRPVIQGKGVTIKTEDGRTEEHETVKLVPTGLDGSFTIAGVKPGNYYVMAEKLGYRSPNQITGEEMSRPTEQVARTMAALLTPVSVAAYRTSTVEVRLLRGAAIDGVARFDDGAPDGAAQVQLWRRNEKKEWERYGKGVFVGSTGNTSTDDAGHFRFSGLPGGEYLVNVQLELSTMIVDRVISGEGQGTYSNSDYSLSVYAPSSARRKDAKVVKIGDQEERGAVDIEVPLSKMHPVNGWLAVEQSGRRVNAGRVALVYADDGTELASTEVRGEDEAFHLNFVPEGEYTLKVTKARDVTRTEVSNGPPGTVPPTHTEEKTVRSYGDATQPLVVVNDVTGLAVSVPAAKAAVTGAAQ